MSEVNDMTTDFDNALDERFVPAKTREAAIELQGDLNLSWKCVQSVFGDSAKPEQAIEVCKLLREKVKE